MRRGEVWWGDFAPPVGRRSVVLLSRDEVYGIRGLIIVTPVTTHARGLPTEVVLGPDDGLARVSVANLDVIHTVPKRRLRARITALSDAKLRAVEAAIHFALGMEM